MDIREQRSWMYNRLAPGVKGITNEFIQGVDEFVHFASQLPSYPHDGVFRCPCAKDRNQRLKDPEHIKVDLYRYGFLPDYWYWTSHGEVEPVHYYDQFPTSTYDSFGASSSQPPTMFEQMIFDASGNYCGESSQFQEEPPNSDAQRFYDLLDAARRPLWDGCTSYSELTVAVKMLSIKSDYNMPRACFNEVAKLLKDTNPQVNLVPEDLYRTKKLVSKLGLTSEKIDCCMNGCMLYYKARAYDTHCSFCGVERFKPKSQKPSKQKNVPYKRMFYLPLIPRLQRLYASMRTAPHMTWHKRRYEDINVMRHPADGEAWKHFDRSYPEFAAEPRNIRLGLCSDGFTPYSQAATPYSCWPVIVTPYNLPPDLCMTSPFLFLTLIIPGPSNPKAKIDVYLQPLIDELQILWESGVQTYDVSLKHNFNLRAALMWTISDFPAYGMLSGWSTAGKLACPYCMNESKAFTLKHGRKNTWFDSHRRFLARDHPFRRNKDAFLKNRVEKSDPPLMLSGHHLWDMVCNIPKITEQPDLATNKLQNYGVTHNWIKRSIFWDLPYWRTNLIRHNLDVMHIEKNFFDNIFNTVLDVRGKTKDNLKARLDLKEYCKRRDLELQET